MADFVPKMFKLFRNCRARFVEVVVLAGYDSMSLLFAFGFDLLCLWDRLPLPPLPFDDVGGDDLPIDLELVFCGVAGGCGTFGWLCE